MMSSDDDDDVYYYMRWSLKLEGETENMGVCTKERKGVTAAVLMATPCTNSLGGESGGQKHEGCGGGILPRRYLAGGRKKKNRSSARERAVDFWRRLALLVAMGNAVQKEMEIALDLDEGDNLYAWAQTTLNFTAPASQRTERRYVPEFGALFRRAVAV